MQIEMENMMLPRRRILLYIVYVQNRSELLYMNDIKKILTVYLGYDIIVIQPWPRVFGYLEYDMSLCVRKPTIWVPTRSDTNQAVHSQKMVRGLKFCI